MVIIISEFGIKIKNISAGTLYDVNLGTRDYFSYTEAMLNNSLFSAFLIKNGLNVYKGESTRDIICLDFDFGTRSYEDEHKRIEQLYKNSDGELKERLKYTLEKVENNKDLYDEKKREQIRDKFYNEGVDVTYKTKNKDGTIKSEETIHYEMLFRTSAKAKLGQVIFINSELYEVAYEWLTIGLGKLMTDDNAKIVEMSAYAPLTTSTIVGTKYIPVEDILILRDQDSFFKTMANIVRAEDYIDSKTIKETGDIVAALQEVIMETLKAGEDIRVPGFGSLEVKDVAGRKGRNPLTGEDLMIKPHKTVKAKLAKAVKDAAR